VSDGLRLSDKLMPGTSKIEIYKIREVTMFFNKIETELPVLCAALRIYTGESHV